MGMSNCVSWLDGDYLVKDFDFSKFEEQEDATLEPFRHADFFWDLQDMLVTMVEENMGCEEAIHVTPGSRRSAFANGPSVSSLSLFCAQPNMVLTFSPARHLSSQTCLSIQVSWHCDVYLILHSSRQVQREIMSWKECQRLVGGTINCIIQPFCGLAPMWWHISIVEGNCQVCDIACWGGQQWQPFFQNLWPSNETSFLSGSRIV